MTTATEKIAHALPNIHSTTRQEELKQAVGPVHRNGPPSVEMPAMQNPAVFRCVLAYSDAYRAAIESGKQRFPATDLAERAFRQSLPPLTGSQNIRDFIACIAQAMLMQAISSADATRLLYAAQVAQAADRGAERKTPPSSIRSKT